MENLKLMAAFEEYKGIRAEQVARISAQATMISPIIALLGILGAFAPDFRAYLPILVCPISLTYYSYRLWINHLSQYSREVLWPIVCKESGYSNNWEVFTRRLMWRGWRLVIVMFFEAGLPMLLILFSIVMMFLANPMPELLFWVDVGAIAFTALGMPFAVCVNELQIPDSSQKCAD